MRRIATYGLTCLSFLLAVPGRGAEQDNNLVEQLVAGAKARFAAISSLDVGVACQYSYPDKNIARAVGGRLRTSRERIRLDYSADLFDYGDKGQVLGTIKRNNMASYDGQRTFLLPAEETIFAIWPGDRVPEYRLLFQGAYMFGQRVDEWLTELSLEYKGKSEDRAAPGQLFVARRAAADKGGERSFEIRALPEKGFAIAACTVRDGHGRLLSEYTAGDFRELTPGVWAAQEILSRDFDPNRPSAANRQRSVKLSFDRVNEPIDDAIFQLSPPPGYVIRDHVVDVTVWPQDVGVVDIDRNAPIPLALLSTRPENALRANQPVADAQSPAVVASASPKPGFLDKGNVPGTTRAFNPWTLILGLVGVAACAAFTLRARAKQWTWGGLTLLLLRARKSA